MTFAGGREGRKRDISQLFLFMAHSYLIEHRIKVRRAAEETRFYYQIGTLISHGVVVIVDVRGTHRTFPLLAARHCRIAVNAPRLSPLCRWRHQWICGLVIPY